jgi:hypothetical protein
MLNLQSGAHSHSHSEPLDDFISARADDVQTCRAMTVGYEEAGSAIVPATRCCLPTSTSFKPDNTFRSWGLNAYLVRACENR